MSVKVEMRSLTAVTQKLDQAGIRYSLGGSGLLLSLGLIDTVGDWDVMVEAPKVQVLHALQHNRIEEKISGDYPFATQYKLVVLSDTPEVEIISGLAIHTDKGLCRLPSTPCATWNGIQIGSPEVWYIAYALMNRTVKAALLLAYLKETGADQDILNNMMNEPLPDEIMDELGSLMDIEKL
ncbi:hypothetical protein [Paenibacillus qinlingensis]|uniref:Uncharacterized protein n=1 Tax=Paenibacillus qinlingensis TaxID=1837343 RepID=A0ABU1NW90_9BACL|nr:hypothetical protein [Paenibacillus qinlingensis]MDR6551599.1 hypothetical protein [Paenibacillus qinlingensis]